MKAKTILVLAANPKMTSRLRLDQEVRDIEDGLQRSSHREQFRLEQRWAVRPKDVRRSLLDLKPEIVHFSGHGAEDQRLILEDDTGNPQFVAPEALADLFALFSDTVECVVLNACYSEAQATAIAQHIPFVIGMNQAIGDTAAREFAVAFYDALGAGRSIEFAYRLGCAAIRMAGIEEHLTPILIQGKAQQRSLSPGLSIPNNLPYSGATVFVGREKALEDLHGQLQQGQTVAISAISGMGGIGKTELALQYADRHRETETYPGGICWLRAREEVGTQILGFARSHLDLDPPVEGELKSRVDWCWQRWRSGDALIVFDDVQKFDEIRSFLPPRESRFKVLMTSRSRFGSPVQTYEIPVLDEASSLKLLGAIVSVEAIDAELETAKQVCEWLGYLPLALELVGRYWKKNRNWSLAKVFEKLKEKELGARAFVRSQETTATHEALVAAFDLSWQELNGNAQRLGAYLSVLALAPIPWGMVEAALSEWDEEDLQEARSTLVDFSLITDLENEWYELHPLIRLFFASKLPESEGAQEWKQALCRVAVGVCEQIEDSITIQRVEELLPVIPHLEIVAQTLAQDYCEDEDLIWVFGGLTRFYSSQGLHQQSEVWCEKRLQVVEDRLGTDHPGFTSSLNNLAAAYQWQGRYSDAEPLLQQALALWRQQFGDDDIHVVVGLNNLAAVYRHQGRYDEAETLHEEVLWLMQQFPRVDHPVFATNLSNLAELYKLQGRYTEAEELYEQALILRQQLLGYYHPDVAISLDNLASVYSCQERYDEAELIFQQSLELMQQLLGFEHPHVATNLSNLAGLHLQQERYSEAEQLFKQALQVHIQTQGVMHPDVAINCHNLAVLYITLERYAEAETFSLHAFTVLSQRLGDAHFQTEVAFDELSHLVSQAIQAGRSGELSDHPLTRSLLEQLQNNAQTPENDQS